MFAMFFFGWVEVVEKKRLSFLDLEVSHPRETRRGRLLHPKTWFFGTTTFGPVDLCEASHPPTDNSVFVWGVKVDSDQTAILW